MDWFCIISDDDYLENDHFSSLIDLVFNFPKSYFACNHTKIFDKNKFYKSPSMKFKKWNKSSFFSPLKKLCGICTLIILLVQDVYSEHLF